MVTPDPIAPVPLDEIPGPHPLPRPEQFTDPTYPGPTDCAGLPLNTSSGVQQSGVRQAR
jgi:hypothetical protein